MFPIILKLGPLTIRTYGLLVAIGLFVSLKYILYNIKNNNLKENTILDLVLYTIVAGLIGARITYVLFNLPFYSHHIGDIFKIWEGGLVFYGGFAFGFAALVVFIRFHPEIKFWELADIIAPALAIGHFFGRLGCFFAGCCYGLETNIPWAVKFTNQQALAPLNIPLHPTQVYEAAINLIIFFGLHFYNKSRHQAGMTFAAYLMLYGIMRFLLEFFRGDDRGTFLLGFSPGQLISIIIVIIALYLFNYFKRKSF